MASQTALSQAMEQTNLYMQIKETCMSMQLTNEMKHVRSMFLFKVVITQ